MGLKGCLGEIGGYFGRGGGGALVLGGSPQLQFVLSRDIFQSDWYNNRCRSFILSNMLTNMGQRFVLLTVENIFKYSH